jgi:hypothetical protein
MAVNEDLSAYSTSAASNTPSGSSNVGPDLDNHLRDIKRNVRRVAERYQGVTTPEAFRGREWLDTSGTAATKLELTMNDGSNEVPYMDFDTSAGTARPIIDGTTVPADSMAIQAKSSVDIDGGAIDGAVIGANSAAAGTFTSLTATNFTAGIKLQSGQDTLDQYDEGVWTPTLQDSSASDGEGQTYSSQDGEYTRIGRVVFVSGKVTISSKGTLTGNNSARIAGLPFAAAAGTRGTLVINFADSMGLAAAGQSMVGYIVGGNSHSLLYVWDSTAGTTLQTIDDIDSTMAIEFSGTYFV